VCAGKAPEIAAAAEQLVNELCERDLSVIFDDRRGASPGVKFKDAELIGVPTILVIGKGLADGVVEIKDRRSMESEIVPIAAAVARIHETVRR
jgi:prolyl-tRNA synthetase